MKQENSAVAVQDYRLLLHQLENLSFDQKGNEKAAAILGDRSFWQSLSPEDVQSCARIAQMHGEVEKALEMFNWLHEAHPQCVAVWQEHVAVLGMLGRGAELTGLRARAALVLTADCLAEIFSRDMAVGAAGDEEDEKWLGAPFEKLHRQEERIDHYRRLFFGRTDVFARQWRDKKTGGQGYVPVRRPMQVSDLRDHINGRRTYGIYLMQPGNLVSTGVIDIDLVSRFRDRKLSAAERDQLRREGLYMLGRIRELGAERNMVGLAEFSGGKGYHFWYPVREPVSAQWMRGALQSLVDQVKDDISCFAFEVFPKQDKVSGKGFGNLVKLPLGIHRKTGKPSWFLDGRDKDTDGQLDFLSGYDGIDPAAIEKSARKPKAEISVHPRHQAWAKKYPELAALESKCVMLAQIMASLRQSKLLNVREEKILLGTLAHLPRSRVLLHYLFSGLPEYNRPLLDYRISRIRGTPLGCKRIHSLLEDGGTVLPCRFESSQGYPHPLLHLPKFLQSSLPKSEKIENFQDAVNNLKTAIIEFERFLPRPSGS